MPADESSTQLNTVWPVDTGTESPREIVILVSSGRGGTFTATAHRTWVHDMDGTGLESDQMDPVLILQGPGRDLESFHRRAVLELEFRRIVDYEVADLFVPDP